MNVSTWIDLKPF